MSMLIGIESRIICFRYHSPTLNIISVAFVNFRDSTVREIYCNWFNSMHTAYICTVAWKKWIRLYTVMVTNNNSKARQRRHESHKAIAFRVYILNRNSNNNWETPRNTLCLQFTRNANWWIGIHTQWTHL